MNVAVFASAYYPHLGGVEELCRQLAQEYRKRGLGVVILTNRWPRSLPARETIDGIDVMRIPFRFPDESIKSRVNYLVTNNWIQLKLDRILRKFKVDILHVQCINASTAYAIASHRRLKLPLIVTTQGERTMDASGLFQRSVPMQAVFRQAVISADWFTACSIHTLDDVKSHFHSDVKANLRVIYNGVRLSDFSPPHLQVLHDRPYVLAIGRHVRQKGFDILLRAWSRLNNPSHDLLLAGDGPEHAALRDLAAELNIKHRVRFFGAADRNAAASLFYGCSFFVLPSRIEPLGIVNLEAMAAGKAVIATRTGGVPELVTDGQTGVLVEPDDFASLSKAIGSLMTDSTRRDQLGSAGRTRAEAFDWSSIAEQYISLYGELLGTRSLKPVPLVCA